MRTRLIAAVVLAGAGVLMLAGCASQSKSQAHAGAKPVNAVCPVGGHAVDATATTVEYKGQAVGFCCDDCAPKWAAMTDAQKDKALAKAMAKGTN